MSRRPEQVLVIPFRHSTGGSFEFLLLHREDADVWQGVAGGVESGESAAEAAAREASEELGVVVSKLLQLDARGSVPAGVFKQYRTKWADNVLIVPECSYGFLVEPGVACQLSDEHDDSCWLPYEEATEKFTFDSNRTALWELNERLRHNQLRWISSW